MLQTIFSVINIIQALAFAVLIYIILGVICLCTIKSWNFFQIGLWVTSILGGLALSYLIK